MIYQTMTLINWVVDITR